MDSSRRVRFALRPAILLLMVVPLLAGADEGADPPEPGFPGILPIAPTNVRSMLVACDLFDFGDPYSLQFNTACAQPAFAANADPTCNEGEVPSFFVGDGRIYDTHWSETIDFAPLLGNERPNAPTVPIVPIAGSNLVLVFFGYAPPAGSLDAPMAFFVALDRDALKKGAWTSALRGSWPLDIGYDDNLGCGTIHLTGATQKNAYPNSATVFVSTCQHAYGVRVSVENGENFTRDTFFRQEIPLAKKATHHRAEMAVMPYSDSEHPDQGGYELVWPFEDEAGENHVSITFLRGDGKVISTFDKHLDFSKLGGGFVKGLEVDQSGRNLFVTWPGEPTKLLRFELLDQVAMWSTKSTPTVVYEGFPIGSSQIETGPDNKLYMLTDDRIVVGTPNETGNVDTIGRTWATMEGKSAGWQGEDLLRLPAMNRGSNNGCPSAEGGTSGAGLGAAGSSVGAGGFGNNSGAGGGAIGTDEDVSEECVNCSRLWGAYYDDCWLQYKACMNNPGCKCFFDEVRWTVMSSSSGACSLLQYEQMFIGSVGQEAIDLYRAVDQCVSCNACLAACAPLSTDYCDTIKNKGADCL